MGGLELVTFMKQSFSQLKPSKFLPWLISAAKWSATKIFSDSDYFRHPIHGRDYPGCKFDRNKISFEKLRDLVRVVETRLTRGSRNQDYIKKFVSLNLQLSLLFLPNNIIFHGESRTIYRQLDIIIYLHGWLKNPIPHNYKWIREIMKKKEIFFPTKYLWEIFKKDEQISPFLAPRRSLQTTMYSAIFI